MSTTVLVVDDDVPVRRMLHRSLDAEGFTVRAAADGGQALAAVEAEVPDAIVLDVSMPGLDGLAVCRRLRERGLAVPILMLTARDTIGDRVAGLDTGADDYLVKPFAIEELVARLHALTRRGSLPVLAAGNLRLDRGTRIATRDGRQITLTQRESELLTLLLQESGRVVTRDVAITTLWGDAAVPNVVDRYVANLRRKLGEPQLIHTVRGAGFMLRG